MHSLPEASTISSLPPPSQSQILDALFESSPHLHQLARPVLNQHEPWTGYPDLIDAIKGRLFDLANNAGARAASQDDAVEDADVVVLRSILGSHPRLGESSASSKTQLSEASKREQANLTVSPTEQGKEEANRLMQLNNEYETRFPGLRYVVFVNGRGRDVIMQDMQRRIKRGDINLEIEETIQLRVMADAKPASQAMAPVESRADGLAKLKMTNPSTSRANGSHTGQLGNEKKTVATNRSQPILPAETTAAAAPPRIQTSFLQTQQAQNHGLSKALPSPSTSTLAFYEQQEQSPIDPLSQLILKRTNTEKSLSSKIRSQQNFDVEPGTAEVHRSLHHEDISSSSRIDLGGQTPAKEKRKAVSFLSRIIGSKRKDHQSETNDDVSEPGEDRITGMDGEVFGQPIGYIPRYPPPPKYIKVRSRYTRQRVFNRLFIAQQLRDPLEKSDSTPGPMGDKAIWAAEFSKDGRYLAVAGQDKRVRVWAIISSLEERQAHEAVEGDDGKDQTNIRLSAPVFQTIPIRVYTAHTASIVDLSWSKNNFLLTTSMDKTVRLWHVTRDECLCCFKHNDFVTSIEFHPRDDRFFLAGSLDRKLRLWSIPDKAVAYRVTLSDMITAVAFTPDGRHSIAGCLNGFCMIFDTDGLKPLSQMHVRSARGKNAKGSKITGIDAIVQPPNQEHGIIKLLITSNDSRIRLYNFKDRTLEAKFRGNENMTSQIRANFSSDGNYVICGSEDGRAYIWPVNSTEKYPDKRPVEFFEAHSSTVTTAIMAPVNGKQILGTTGDLLYDLCNPPPVNPSSESASVVSREKQAEQDSVPSTPYTSQRIVYQKAEESPSWVARSSHPEGNIIVTADYEGNIKVFRQDCGYHARHDLWDTNSMFSRKILGRTNSISTRHSIASVGKDSLNKTPSERILSWRNAVVNGPDNRSLENVSGSRSASPSKSFRRASGHRRAETMQTNNILSPLQSRSDISKTPVSEESPTAKILSSPSSGERRPIPSFRSRDSGFISPSSDNNHVLFRKPKFGGQVTDKGQPPFLGLDGSVANGAGNAGSISEMTSDLSSSGEEREENGVEDEEELKCSKCHGTNFRATRPKVGDQRLICIRCGLAES
ncbi:hypothetical protein FQN57_004284 [Myotisia sp. PD_48]|nr:hypothetical protein FQN57_004284 [Myotisia sp. PD_48]